MDYKEKYLKLKKYVLESNQRGSGKLNPLFANNLSNLAFVVDNNVLGDDAHAVITSLIEEFNKIATLDLKHNPEISQYYSVGNGLADKNGTLICENCEIVLKYSDATVCVTNSKNQHSSNQTNINKSNMDCYISRGSIRFYIKKKEGDSYKYTKIRVVDIQKINSLQPYLNSVYQNTDEMNRLEEAGNIALSRGQTDAILSTSKNGRLDVTNPEQLSNTTNTINDIITESKNAIVHSQLNKMNNQRVLSSIPTQNAVNAANTVANTIMNTNAAKNAGLTTVMIPNNEPISLFATDNVNVVPATIGDEGITIKAVGGTNTMNSRIINNRSSLTVDAKLAIVPINGVVTDGNVDIAIPNNNSLTAASNKLVAMSKDFYNKTGDMIGDIFNKAGRTLSDAAGKASKTLSDAVNKVGDTFTNKPDLSKPIVPKASVVPVSQNMSVLTSLPKEKAIVNVPIPQNDTVAIANQKINTTRFENKIANSNQLINVEQSNKVSTIIKNGNASIKRIQEESPINKNIEMSETSASNRTVTKPKQSNIDTRTFNQKNSMSKLVEDNRRRKNIY